MEDRVATPPAEFTVLVTVPFMDGFSLRDVVTMGLQEAGKVVEGDFFRLEITARVLERDEFLKGPAFGEAECIAFSGEGKTTLTVRFGFDPSTMRIDPMQRYRVMAEPDSAYCEGDGDIPF